MSIKTAITAVMLLSATALPALAENYANDPARPDAPIVRQQPLFGGIVAGRTGAAKDAASQPAERRDASNGVNLPTRTDAIAGSSVPPHATDPHMYDYLSGPEYRGGA